MRRVDVLIGALSQLTGRDEEAVAQTFEAIISSNPDKGKDLLAEITFSEASAMVCTIEKIQRDCVLAA